MATGTTAADAATRAALIEAESYAVFLDLSSGSGVARSRTEVRFSCRKPGAATFADLDVVAVHEVALNGDPVDPRTVADGRLPLPGLAADNTLIVEATVALSRSGSGLTQYTDPADGQRYVLANCFPTAAPSVFCCFDQPDMRASFTLIVTLPAGWTCLSTGEVLHRPADGAAGVWRFSTVAAIKPYEFTLCAGPYVAAPGAADEAAPDTGPGQDTAGATRLAVHCRATLASSPGLARIAGLVGSALCYYEQLLAVPCPYDKLDIVFAPELGPLAMQLPAVMYVSESLLQRAADPQDDHVAVVLAHEAAHLWFGCMVEGRWWDDLWLAESMATYLSYEAVTEALGQPAAWAEFGMSGQASAYQADGLPSTQPVSSPVDTAADALTRPSSITYAKGASVIRQLAALIGADATRAGLHDYLTTYAWQATSLADLIGCWSRASGRDLTHWAAEWLQHPGANALRPEITIGPESSIMSLAIVQTRPPVAGGLLRTHQLAAGIYELDGSTLARTRGISLTVSDDWTHVPELTGNPMPAAIILNDTDLTFATIRLDPVSWRALVSSAMDVGDSLAGSVCWNAAWDMVQAAELEAAEFAAIVARRMTAGRPVSGLDQLLDRAVTAADFYAGQSRRTAARQHLSAAALTAAERAEPASRDQRILAHGFAISADSQAQLEVLRFWLGGRSLPAGLVVGLELRAKILATLAARDLVSPDDLAAYAADDPVGGDTVVATCAARRPVPAAKESAWSAALADGQLPRLALAHAQGFWVPGQEQLATPFRDRYFAEALPAIRRHDAPNAQRLARALYPATLADDATLAATEAAIGAPHRTDAVRAILLEQHAILSRVIAARSIGGQESVLPD